MCLCVFMFVLSLLLRSLDFLTTRNKRTFNLLIKNEPTTIDKNTSVAFDATTQELCLMSTCCFNLLFGFRCV